MGQFITDWFKGEKLFLTKYFDAVPVEVFIPNEIGVGMLVKVSFGIFRINEIILKILMNCRVHLWC